MPMAWSEIRPAGDFDWNWICLAVSADGNVMLAGKTPGSEYDPPGTGRLYLSTDGGSSWAETQPAGDTDLEWYVCACDSDGSVLIAGVAVGRLYLSTNGGASWAEVQPAGDTDITWYGLACDSDGSTIIACNGYAGRVYLSTNSGASWAETQPAGDADKNWYCVACNSDGSVLMAGIGATTGRLYLSTNGGASWAETQPAGDANKNWRICAVDSDGSVLFAGGYYTRLYVSVNGGSSWAEVQPAGAANKNWRSCACDSDGSVLIAGIEGSRLYLSINTGTDWAETQPAGASDEYWRSLACNADGTILLAGNYSERLHKMSEYSGPEIPLAELTLEAFAPAHNLAMIPLISLTLEAFTPAHNLAMIPLAELTLAAFAPYRYNDIPLAELTLAAFTPIFGESGVYIPLGSVVITAFAPSQVWALPAAAYPASQVIYICTLTGGNESPPLADLILPMSSFQGRLRDGDPSYLYCVIPVATDYADDIQARSNGEIVIQKGYRLLDGTTRLEEIARVDFESLVTDRGGRSDTASITGHKTTSATVAKERVLSGLQFIGLRADGKRWARADVDMFLRPGDTIIYDLDGSEESFIAGQISYTVGSHLATMEVTEA